MENILEKLETEVKSFEDISNELVKKTLELKELEFKIKEKEMEVQNSEEFKVCKNEREREKVFFENTKDLLILKQKLENERLLLDSKIKILTTKIGFLKRVVDTHIFVKKEVN